MTNIHKYRQLLHKYKIECRQILIHTNMRKFSLSSGCKYVCPTSADWCCYEMRRHPTLSKWRSTHVKFYLQYISNTQKKSPITDIHIKYTPTPSLLTSDARQMSNFIFYGISNTQIEVHQIQIWKCLLHKTCFVQ